MLLHISAKKVQKMFYPEKIIYFKLKEILIVNIIKNVSEKTLKKILYAFFIYAEVFFFFIVSKIDNFLCNLKGGKQLIKKYPQLTGKTLYFHYRRRGNLRNLTIDNQISTSIIFNQKILLHCSKNIPR